MITKTNEWQCYLTTLKFVRRDGGIITKRAGKNIADNRPKFATGLHSCDKILVNCAYDVTDLDQVGPISILDV